MSLALARIRAIANQFTRSSFTAPRPLSTKMVSRYKHATMNKQLMNFSKSDKKESNILNWVSPSDKSGEFKRQTSVFRNFIENKSGAEFPAEKDRYHLYVSYACPWAHRTLIVRKLKGLEDIIGFTSVHWHMGAQGEASSCCLFRFCLENDMFG